ncbi:hypothetical protein EB169_02275 [archaeon]|jgi:hypothetical protein|nr:hypothetical protein [archaeon]
MKKIKVKLIIYGWVGEITTEVQSLTVEDVENKIAEELNNNNINLTYERLYDKRKIFITYEEIH